MSFLDDWKEWSTAKKAISIIGVCCIGILILAALGGGLSSDKNTAPTTTDNTNNNDTAKEQAKGVQVHVVYDGEWQGALSNGGSTKTISGSGETTLDVEDPEFSISANAQKMDDGSGKLTIEILKDGKVLKESDTDSEYGVASVATTV